jgi:hypothetical protein
MPRSIGGLNTSADHGLFLAAFITNITESEFFGTHKGEKPCNDGSGRSSPDYLSASDPRSFSAPLRGRRSSGRAPAWAISRASISAGTGNGT